MFLCPEAYCTEAPLQDLWRAEGMRSGGGMGWGWSLPPERNRIHVAVVGVSPAFCTTKMFSIISLRDKPLLGLCGCFLGSWPPENPPSPALTSAACVWRGRPAASLRGFPLWPGPSGGPSCHVAASPLGLSPELMEPFEVCTHVVSPESAGPIQRLTDREPKTN